MKRKTKIGFYLILVGFLIFLVTTLLLWYSEWYISGDLFIYLVIIYSIAFFIMGVGGRMIRLRFIRWMEDD